MRIVIATVQVPFLTGGAEILVETLKEELIKRNYEAEIVSIPFKWYPEVTLINSMLMGRMVDLSESGGGKIDLVIAMKFPIFYLKHECKVIWMMHQYRQIYDLWMGEYSDLHLSKNGEKIKKLIKNCDDKYINEAKAIFTISGNVSQRLKKYNGINSTPLYPPPEDIEKLVCETYGDFVFFPNRIDQMKRQRILVQAAKYLKTNTKIFIAGKGDLSEVAYLKKLIRQNNLAEKVKLLGYISRKDKIDYYSNCLCTYYGPYDEDYGYVPVESFFAKKTTIIHTDAGGPLEFVDDNVNGFIVDTDPKKVAERIDYLAKNKKDAKKMGKEGYRTIRQKNINWDYVISNLLKHVNK